MKKTFFILFIAIFVFVSCKNNDDDDDNNTNTGSMSFTMDDKSYFNDATNNTLVEETQMGKTGRRLDLRCNTDKGLFVVTVSNWDWQNPPVNGVLCKTYDTDGVGKNTKCLHVGNTSYCDGAMGTYIKGAKQYFTQSFDPRPGTVTITDCNTKNLTVSGSFDFMLFDMFETDSIDVEGTFTNLKYRVVN
jgi:hypothetical protein